MVTYHYYADNKKHAIKKFKLENKMWGQKDVIKKIVKLQNGQYKITAKILKKNR